MTGLYDMHCHLIPGADDGAATMEEALRLVDMEHRQGVRGILLTPHFRHGMFETDSAVVRMRYAELIERVRELYPDMEMFLGWEYHACQQMRDELKNGDFRIADSEYVLVEFSASHNQKYILNRLREVLSLDLVPIVAHIERYPAVVRDNDFLTILRRSGVRFQVNADSLIGREGFMQKRICGKLLRDNMVDLVGSDAHDSRERVPRLDACARLLSKKMGTEEMERIMFQNPEAILKE